MLRLEVLTPEMERLAPVLCSSLSGMAFTLAEGTALAFECLLAGVRCSFFSFRPRFEPASVFLHGMPLAPVLDISDPYQTHQQHHAPGRQVGPR